MPVFKDRWGSWHQRLLRGQQGFVYILRAFVAEQASRFGVSPFLGNTRLLNNQLTEGSFVLEFRTQKACWKTRCALKRAYECGFWHSEQTLKQGNIETVIVNKIMAMVCTEAKTSPFSKYSCYIRVGFFFSFLKLCLLFICTFCIHIFHITNKRFIARIILFLRLRGFFSYCKCMLLGMF